MYQGGTNTFPVPFDKGYYGEVKVLFVRRGVTGYEYEPASSNYDVNGRLYAWGAGSNYIYTRTPTPAVNAPIYNAQDVATGKTVASAAGQTITVSGTSYSRATQHDISNHLILTWKGAALSKNDYICIGRDTESGQPYSLPNNQKHIEGALDHIERQVQELKDKTDNALVVDPTHTIDASKMGPIDWLKTIVRSKDYSARGLRYVNGYLQYSLDDPEVPESQKSWTSLLNTENITTIREYYDKEKDIRIPQYSKDNGVTWIGLGDIYQRQINVINEEIDGIQKDVSSLFGKTSANDARITALRADMNAEDRRLQSQITDNKNATEKNAEDIAKLFDSKIDKQQGKNNVGKAMIVGADGIVVPKATGAGGIGAVAHDDTLVGAGTDEYPLGVKDKVTITIVEH
jgi:hypothetical protein